MTVYNGVKIILYNDGNINLVLKKFQKIKAQWKGVKLKAIDETLACEKT